MADPKNKDAFWFFMGVILLSGMVLVTVIDLTIKAAILSESTALRLKIEDWERGQKDSGGVSKRNTSNGHNHPIVLGDVLPLFSSGLETEDADKRTTPATQSQTARSRKPRNQARGGEVPPAN
jgi:hypothetical protein